MKSSLDKTSEVNGIITIELEKADYGEKVDKSLNQLRHRANIPGFRQGKVPKGIIQKMYGQAVLVEEINKMVSKEVIRFIQENNLKVLGGPMANTDADKKVDIEKDEILTFFFDVALTPEFQVSFNKEVLLDYHKVTVDAALIDKQIDAFRQNFGEYRSVEDEAEENDLIKGTLTECVEGDGEPKVIEKAILMPSYIRDEETRNRFIGAKKGESIVFNPKKAYDNNDAEVASLLQTTKEAIREMSSDYCFDIKEVTRYLKAPLDQALFDRVFGEGAVDSQESFRTKVREELEEQFKSESDHLFVRDIKEFILSQMKEVVFPEATLKRWLLQSDKEKTEEQVEKEFPRFLEELKIHIVHEQIIEKNEIKMEHSDIEAYAKKVARAQFARYGITSLPEESLRHYTKSMLENEETVRDLYDRVLEEKIIDWFKEHITLNEKEHTSEEFNALLKEDTHLQEEAETVEHVAEKQQDGREKQEVTAENREKGSHKQEGVSKDETEAVETPEQAAKEKKEASETTVKKSKATEATEKKSKATEATEKAQ